MRSFFNICESHDFIYFWKLSFNKIKKSLNLMIRDGDNKGLTGKMNERITEYALNTKHICIC